MSDKLRLRKRFLTLWARIALSMLPIAEEENMNATTSKKMEEKEDVRFIFYLKSRSFTRSLMIFEVLLSFPYLRRRTGIS